MRLNLVLVLCLNNFFKPTIPLRTFSNKNFLYFEQVVQMQTQVLISIHVIRIKGLLQGVKSSPSGLDIRLYIVKLVLIPLGLGNTRSLQTIHKSSGRLRVRLSPRSMIHNPIVSLIFHPSSFKSKRPFGIRLLAKAVEDLGIVI